MIPPPTVYVLDANVFVQAHRRHYALDLCPGFWDFLVHENTAGRIISIDRVRQEILEGDALDAWARTLTAGTFFATTVTPEVVASFSAMMQWVYGNAQYRDEAKAEFAAVADGWLAAYAKAHQGHVVVTHEEFNADAKKRVPLPNVCKEFGVPYVDTFAMLRALQARFVLASPTL